MKTELTLFEYMESWEDSALSTAERKEQLMDAVVDYNESNGTNHNPLAAYFNYERERKKETKT